MVESTAYLEDSESGFLALPEFGIKPMMFEVLEGKTRKIKQSNDFFVTYNKKNNQEVGVFKGDYKLTPVSEGVDVVEQMLSESGINLEGLKRTIETSHNEALVKVKWTIPSQIIEVGLNDICALQIFHKTSFNGAWAWQVGFEILRLKCLNGMVGSEQIFLHKKKNTKALDPNEGRKKLFDMIAAFDRQADEWSEWTTKSISDRDALYLFAKTSGCKVPENALMPDMTIAGFTNRSLESSKSFQYMKNRYLNVDSKEIGRNKWAVFNTMTHWSSHAPADKESDQQNILSITERRKTKVERVMQDNLFLFPRPIAA